MKNITKIFTLFIVMCVLLGVFTACNGTSYEEHNTSPPVYTIPEYDPPPEPPDIEYPTLTVPSLQIKETETDDHDIDEPKHVARYAASSESDKYHRISCYYVDRIKSYNIVYYYTENEAIDDSKKPCSVCKP